MPKYILLLFVIVIGCAADDPLSVEIVETDERGTEDGLDPIDLSAAGKGWQIDGATGTLRTSGPATLELLPAGSTMTLAFSIRAEEGTQAALKFGRGHSLNLTDLGIDGRSPETKAALPSPGVWHDIELAYRPAESGGQEVLTSAYVDGTPVYYQQVLDDGGPAQAVVLEVTAGTLEVQQPRHSESVGTTSSIDKAGEVTLQLAQIAYAYYTVSGAPKEFTDWEATPTHSGFTERLDMGAIRDSSEGYALRYTAALEVPQAGTYTFALNTQGDTRLYLDGEPLVRVGSDGQGRVDSNQITLTEGVHDLRIDHYQVQNGWRLSVTYTTPGGQTKELNGLRGQHLAGPVRGSGHPVELDDRPYLLRSFLFFPPARLYQPVEKRTHVVNVGQRGGPHYSYDLERGTLLQAWRGDFVDVQEMWDGRGEQQVARPLGPVLAFNGGAQWSDSADKWADTLTDLHHSRYELDPQGRPTFFFTDGSRTVSDKIVPQADQLVRTLTNEKGSGDAYTVLATANRIDELAPGEFALRGPGAKLSITELPVGKLHLLRGQGIDRLTLSLPPGDHVTYNLSW